MRAIANLYIADNNTSSSGVTGAAVLLVLTETDTVVDLARDLLFLITETRTEWQTAIYQYWAPYYNTPLPLTPLHMPR